METATEVRMRQAEYWRTHGAELNRIGKLITESAIDAMLNLKVPCIKYGRQKRRYRRMFPRIDFKVSFN